MKTSSKFALSVIGTSVTSAVFYYVACFFNSQNHWAAKPSYVVAGTLFVTAMTLGMVAGVTKAVGE